MISAAGKKYAERVAPFVHGQVELWDLGAELRKAFQKFYQHCGANHELTENYTEPLPDDLISASAVYFDDLAGQDDAAERMIRYVENFLPLWNTTKKRNRNLWSAVLRTVNQWERESSKQLYKGTLFYFWGESHIRYGESDKGFILLHRAMEEDRTRAKGGMPSTPAHAFLTLDDSNQSDLQPIVTAMVAYVQKRLEVYRSTRSGNLSFAELRAKFIDQGREGHADAPLFFSYTVFKLIKLRLIHKLQDIADEQMAPLIFTTTLANLLLVVDHTFKLGLYQTPGRMNVSFLDHLIALKQLSRRAGEQYRRVINNSRLYDENFERVLASLLDGSYRDNAGAALEPLETDVVVAYRLRNYSAHSVTSQRALWQRFPEVVQAVFNSFFVAVERL